MSNRQLLSIIVSGLLPTMALCQIPFSTPVDGSTPPAFAPGSATGSYALSGFESVNLFNGALNFTLPLVELKGRGKTGTPLVLPIERKWYVLVGDNNGATIRSAVPEIVNTLGSPGKLEFRETGRDLFTNCTSPMYRETLTRIIFQRGDGSEMEFVDTKTGGGPQTTMEINNGAASGTFTCPSTAEASRGRVWVTRDGSFATLILDSALTDGTSYYNAPPVPSGGGPNAYIFFKDGTRYKFTNQVLVETRDRNGNRTEFVYTSLRLTSMRDSIGRQVTILYDQVVDTTNPARRDVYDLIQYPSYGGGQTKAIKVHYCALDPLADDPVAPTCPNYTGITTKTFANLFGLNGSTTTKFNPRVVSFVELPDGRRYEFKYNEFGELTRVKLPTGGGFGYEWGPGVGADVNGLVYPFGANPMISRRVNKRVVYRSGDIIEGQIAYAVTESSSGCPTDPNPWCSTVTVSQQDGVGTSRQTQKHYFYGGATHPESYFDANYYPRPTEGREYRVQQLNVPAPPIPPAQPTAPQVISSSDTMWEMRSCVAGELCPTAFALLRGSPVDLRVRKTTNTLHETGKVSSEETTSFDRYNNPLVMDEAGFDGLYRRKLRSYMVDAVNGKSYTRPLASNGLVDDLMPDPNQTVHIRTLPREESTVELTGNTTVARTEYEYDVHTGGLPRHAARTVTNAPYRDTTIPNERGNLTQATQHLYALTPTIPSAKTLLTNLLYDDAGNVVGVVDPKGNQTSVEYSATYAAAWPTKVVNAAAHSVQTAYDFNTGFPASFIDANNNVTTYARADMLDRLTSVTLPDTGLTEFKYCDAGSSQGCESGMEVNSYRKKVKQNSCSIVSTIVADGTYDGLGRPIKETLKESATAKIVRETQYDFAGRAYRVSNPTRANAGTEWTETQFDTLGRVIKTLLPDGSATVYEPLGHQITVTDPAVKRTLQVKDAFGRIASVTEDPGGPASFTTNYRYNVLDDLLGVCQGGAYVGAICAGRERTFAYDSLRRLAAATNPESGTIRYTYDDAGNVIERKDGNLVTVTTVYDGLNRPLMKDYGDATPDVTYAWDSPFKGALNRVENTVSKTEYLTFDNLGRVTSSRQTTNAVPYNFTYQYNFAGALEREIYPTGRQVATCYDEAGRISQVKQKANATATETVTASVSAYTPHGALQTLSLGGVITESAQYNNRLQPTQVAAGTWQSNLFYCPGGAVGCTTNNGNIHRQTSIGNTTWDYGYDELNRLKSVTEAVSAAQTWKQNFRFDAYGNRWLLNETQTLIPYLYSTPRAALASDPSPFTANNQWTGTAYDAAGNQKFAWGDGTAVGSAKYFYDGDSRMKKADVVLPSTVTESTEYGYDGDGRRVTKKVATVPKLVWVYDAMGQLVAEYGETPAMPCTTCYLTADHLGSTRVIWGSDGVIKKLLDYAPFGEEVTANYRGNDARYPGGLYPRSGGQAVSMEFTGKERDAETGLDYFGARYMSAAQGRFTSVDPIWITKERMLDPQRLNLYAYGRNNPLKYIDPDGMDITLGRCATGNTQECFNQVVAGLRKEDRSHVHLVQGDGKNGFKKGQSGITVDKDYKSDSGNFQALQKLAGDHSATAQIDVLKPNDKFDVRVAVGVNAGKETFSTMSMTPGNPNDPNSNSFVGYTFFPEGKGVPGPYSTGNFTDVVVNTVSPDGVPSTIHHELRHVLLGDFGRVAPYGAHGTGRVDRSTTEAEKEAVKNSKVK